GGKMIYRIPENIENKLVYRIVKRKNSKAGNVNALKTEGYIVAGDSTEAFKQLVEEFGIDSGFIPVLYKNGQHY
ncbi:MAG: hypothetical protein AABW41_02335, partial [Nanoarchaeota archaeon]